MNRNQFLLGFCTALREARVAKGWTQADLAVRLSVTQTAISYWENGNRIPNLNDLFGLAAALDTAPRDLLPGDLADDALTVARIRQRVIAALGGDA